MKSVQPPQKDVFVIPFVLDRAKITIGIKNILKRVNYNNLTLLWSYLVTIFEPKTNERSLQGFIFISDASMKLLCEDAEERLLSIILLRSICFVIFYKV